MTILKAMGLAGPSGEVSLDTITLVENLFDDGVLKDPVNAFLEDRKQGSSSVKLGGERHAGIKLFTDNPFLTIDYAKGNIHEIIDARNFKEVHARINDLMRRPSIGRELKVLGRMGNLSPEALAIIQPILAEGTERELSPAEIRSILEANRSREILKWQNDEVRINVNNALKAFYKGIYGSEREADANGVFVQLKENGPWYLIVRTGVETLRPPTRDRTPNGRR